MVYIDKAHLYISKMKYTDVLSQNATNECTKADMIDHINKGNSVKTKYISNGYWKVGEDVRVVDNSYLRTDSNNIKKDNLGNLPRY